MCLVSNLCIRNVLHMDCLKWKTQRLTVNLSLELAFGETMPMSNRRNSSMKLHTAGVTRLEAYLNIVQYQTQDAKIQTWRSTKYRFLCLSSIFSKSWFYLVLRGHHVWAVNVGLRWFASSHAFRGTCIQLCGSCTSIEVILQVISLPTKSRQNG